jgi:DNA-binding CsgD family transcriptional regulator
MSVLDVWGLDEGAEAVYRAVLRNPGRDVAWFAAHLEREDQQVTRELDGLVNVGLARREADGFSAGPPATTLHPLVNAELSDLDGRRAQLDAVRASFASFAADHVVGRSRGWAEAPFELLSNTESFAAVEDLHRSTRGEVLCSHQVLNIDVSSPPYVDLLERQLAAGRPMRALYPRDVVDDPRRLAYVRRWAGLGEVVRITHQQVPYMAVFGDQVAIVSSGSDRGNSEGRILLRAPALVSLVTELFGCYWERSVPIHSTPVGLGRNERAEILEGLMLGAKDEALARQLGVSLRTVRRRVADLMAELGATTRFQAGMEAVRRGLV